MSGKEEFLKDVLDGLSKPQKQLHPKYLYDDAGSLLFEQICELDEYYPTRTETAIVASHCKEMAAFAGPGAVVIEPGSGAGAKTRLLLKALSSPAAYVPIEISDDALQRSTEVLNADFPHLKVFPICGDFTGDVTLPRNLPDGRRVIYFPGSTIGNLEVSGRTDLMKKFRRLVGRDGGLLVGIDLQKEDTDVIFRAYNDSLNVTAAFTTNLLKRMNRELGADFDVEQFTHYAPYDEKHHRIEIRLCSNIDQSVTVGGRKFHFTKGEFIITEYSHKFEVSSFSSELARSGFKLEKTWTDEKCLFGVLCFQSCGQNDSESVGNTDHPPKD
eukprot:m.203067 g.203067  ORF g.203067 m.203067 type:complete len:328 (+) comp39619_c0_seq20:865-1848(+)